nr:uncharacterized protein LOC124807733 [Hydra vulgaris]
MSLNQEVKNIMLQNDETKLIALKDILQKNISCCNNTILVDSYEEEKTLKNFEIYLPKSFKEKHNVSYVVLRSQSTGNCLYSSISLRLTGNNCIVNDLRLQTSIELFLNAEFYSNHPTFHYQFLLFIFVTI